MNFLNNIITPHTLFVTSHITIMYLVIDGNYNITMYENIKYYTGLFMITYATEYCGRLRSGRQYIREYQNIDNSIIMPVFAIPVIFALLYTFGFSMVNLLTATRVFCCLVSFGVGYMYHKNFSFVIPLLITYMPILTIILHILVIATSIVVLDFTNFHSILTNN